MGVATAHLVSPAMGAHFSMFLADLAANASVPPPAAGLERWADLCCHLSGYSLKTKGSPFEPFRTLTAFRKYAAHHKPTAGVMLRCYAFTMKYWGFSLHGPRLHTLNWVPEPS